MDQKSGKDSMRNRGGIMRVIKQPDGKVGRGKSLITADGIVDHRESINLKLAWG